MEHTERTARNPSFFCRSGLHLVIYDLQWLTNPSTLQAAIVYLMNEEQYVTKTWNLWPVDKQSISPIEKQVDLLLSGFCSYPEFEWREFGIRPPDNHNLIGSWRDDSGTVFIFLHKENSTQNNSQSEHLIIVTGKTPEVDNMTKLISGLKTSLHSADRKELKRKNFDVSIKEESSNKSVAGFSSLAGIFTVIINAFSFYLRDLPEPTNMHPLAAQIYNTLLSSLHILALLLLLTLIMVAITYVSRYGYMMIRRMK